MLKIITSDKENILTSSKLFFKNSSSDLISSKNIYIISDVEINDFDCRISGNSYFKFFTTSTDSSCSAIISDHENIDLSNVDVSSQNGKFIYRIKLFFTVQNAGIYSANLKLSFKDSTSNYNFEYFLIGEAVELDEKLLITLQNFRKTFNDDYLIAFFESNPKSNAVDFELYNRKIREFLLNSHDLLAMHGSYKNLFSALQFFGYGELLELREYWTNDNIYKSTSIANYVLNYIDKSLAGFKKTNKMSLVYQINEETGLDDDGLPLYTTIFSITEEIMLKMEALKRILEKDFLHFNTFIVDIIGEMQTVIGVEMNVIYNSAIIFNTHLTDNLYVDADKILNKDLLKMKVNKVKVNSYLYKIFNNNLIDNPDFIDYENENIFEIDKIYEKPEDVQNDEFLLNYFQDVFGIIKLDIVINPARYQTFSYRIYDKNSLVFEAKSRNISEFTGSIICAVRKPDQYKIEISFIDWYGGSTFIGVNDYFEIVSNEVVMKLLSYNHKTDKQRISFPSSTKTFSQKNLVPFQKVDQDFDINTYDQLQNLSDLQIKTKYTNEGDVYSTYCRLNELNGVALKSFKTIGIENLGSTYAVCLFDIIGDKTIEGVRYFMIFDHISNSYITIEKLWLQSMEDKQWLMEFIRTIYDNLIEENILNDFSYDIQVFGLEENSSIEEKYLLRLRSKENSYRSRFIDVGISQEFVYHKFPQQFELNDVHVFQFLHSISCFTVFENTSSDDLYVKINDEETILTNVTINSIVDLKNTLSDFIDLYCILDETRNLIYITSKHNFELKHSSFGEISDVTRGKQFAKIYELPQGEEINFGESIIVEFDKTNLMDMHDVKWELWDEISNKLLVTQFGSRLVYLAKIRTTYSIKVSYKIQEKEFEQYHSGCFLVL